MTEQKKIYMDMISKFPNGDFDLGRYFPYSNDLDEQLEQLDVLKESLRSFRPIDEDQVKSIRPALDIEYTYESNRIEGNTLTLQETALVVNEGITISGKSLREHLEVKNHSDSIDFIRKIAEDEISFSKDLIHKIHSIILSSIDSKNAGVFRQVQVMISGSRHNPPIPSLVEQKIDELLNYYHTNQSLIPDVLLAAEIHRKFVSVHPYIDGNGRTARLLMNLILVRSGFPIANIRGDSESRKHYYSALEVAHIDQNYEPFNFLVVNSVKESCIKWLKLLSVCCNNDQGEYFFEYINDLANENRSP